MSKRQNVKDTINVVSPVFPWQRNDAISNENPYTRKQIDSSKKMYVYTKDEIDSLLLNKATKTGEETDNNNITLLHGENTPAEGDIKDSETKISEVSITWFDGGII